ncbi:hypothetical protein BY458DRAFT_535302 [Sporodiniella umbellata]|nr:hypothetical protein BY458DRAFT_535302 [Sporodiniella umbellata]
MSTITFQREIEPYLARLGTTPEDKPSFVKEVYAVQDIDTLRQWVIRKEREKQTISNDLEVAARIGLVISETNEALQLKLEHLEKEYKTIQQEENPEDYEEEKLFLQQELDQAKRALVKFRKEMDGLSAQLNDMASEMVASRAKVGVYAKRLAEVEQKLAATRDVNTNLQSLLDKALASQEKSSTSTSHFVKTIQVDLERVVHENERLRVRIAELEGQQVENEEKIAVMVVQAQEYASRLEQAQNTIHSLSELKPTEEEESVKFDNGFQPLVHDEAKETEITKGPVFSAEFRQEMQKEIERNLNLRNEIRHRIITADSNQDNKKRATEGLKYLVSERDNVGLASLSTSASSSNSSILSTVMKKDIYHSQPEEELQHPKAPMLRPASFLTGFSGFGTEGLGIGGNFIGRGIPPRNFSSISRSDSESSDEEWVITSLDRKKIADKAQNNQSSPKQPRHFTPQTRISKPLPMSPVSPIVNSHPLTISSPVFTPRASSSVVDVSSQRFSEENLEDICKRMDAKKLIFEVICVYKNAKVFFEIRDIETESTFFETRLRDQLHNCQDPCFFIIDCLDKLSLHFSTNGKGGGAMATFRRSLAEMLCKSLSLFSNMSPDSRKIVDDGPDLISFENDEKSEVDLISFDESTLPTQDVDTELEDSSDDDSIPTVAFTEPVSKYSLTRKHQERLIGQISTILSPVLIYYAFDTFKLKDLIGLQCEYEKEGALLSERILKHGFVTEAFSLIRKLNLFVYFPIPFVVERVLDTGHGALLPTLFFNKPCLQQELLQFIEKQLRFNFAGSLGVVPPEKLEGIDTDPVRQLPRLKERRYQKDLVTCGVKVAQDSKVSISDCYFIHLSQRYACLRWILVQRASQQAEDKDLSIEKSSNYNGLIDLICEGDSAMARLTIKELIDTGDSKAPAYFARKYKEESFYCRYIVLPMNERFLGIVKGEQLSRHWTTVSPKKPSNPNRLPFYQLPPSTSWMMINSEKSLIFMKDVLSQSYLCGIDTEWVPGFATVGIPLRTALMQIASDVGGYIFLLDFKTIFSSSNKLLYKLTEKILQFLFEDEEITKIAYDFTGDFQLLYQSIPCSKQWDVVKLIDLKSVTSPPTADAENGLPIIGGLSGVVDTYLGRALNKRQQCSNWEQRPLTEEQAIYAGLVIIALQATIAYYNTTQLNKGLESRFIQTYNLDNDETYDINFAIDRLKRIKWENIAFIGFQCWFVGMTFDAFFVLALKIDIFIEFLVSVFYLIQFALKQGFEKWSVFVFIVITIMTLPMLSFGRYALCVMFQLVLIAVEAMQPGDYWYIWICFGK